MIKVIAGIECGSKSSVITKIGKHGLENVQSEASNREIPCVVVFDEERRLFAEIAQDRLKSFLPQSVQSPFRLCLGVDPKNNKFKYDKLADKAIFNAVQVTPVQIVGAFLGYLDRLITNSTENEGNQNSNGNDKSNNSNYLCIVSAPNYFNIKHKLNLQMAAIIASLPCVAVIEEHQAVGYSYLWYQKHELQNGQPRRVAFVDVGESQTSCYVYQFQSLIGRTQYVSSSADLGVRDIDEILFVFLKQKHPRVFQGISQKGELRVLEAIQKTRKQLSGNTDAVLTVECVNGEDDLQELLTRDTFEKLLTEASWLGKFQAQLRQLVDYCFINQLQIDDVEILGGGSRIPCVQRQIKQAFAREKLGVMLQSGEAVSRGCAIACAVHTSSMAPMVRIENYQIEKVLSKPVTVELVIAGVVIGRSQYEPLTALPIEDILEGSIFEGLEGKVEIHVDGVVFQSQQVISGRDVREVRVVCMINENGLVEIGEGAVQYQQSNINSSEQQGQQSDLNRIQFGESIGYSQEIINQLREQERVLNNRDLLYKQKEEQRIFLEKSVNEWLDGLNQSWGFKISSEQYSSIKTALVSTKDWLESGNPCEPQAVQQALHQLENLIRPVQNGLSLKEKSTVIVSSIEQLQGISQTQTQIPCLHLALSNKNMGDGTSKLMQFFYTSGASKLKELLSSITVKETLRIELGNNQLTDSGMLQVFEAIIPSVNVKELTLNIESNLLAQTANTISQKSLLNFSQLLERMERLEILELFVNEILQEAADVLLQVLLKKRTLRHLLIKVASFQPNAFNRAKFVETLKMTCASVSVECYNARGMKVQ